MKKIIFLFFLLFPLMIKATNTSTIVMDVDSERILYQNNAYEQKLIASTTKIMTFVVAYEYAKDSLDVYVETGNELLEMYGTSIYLSLNEKMSLRDLLYGMMLRSGNDAAIVIANFVGGSEEGFVTLMNKKAKAIGMNNTIFRNPHGLDEKTENYSTAYDMAKLSIYANQIPFYQKVTSTKYYKVQTEEKFYSWTNRNQMLFMYPNLVSGKTGYTPKAGRTLVTSAKKDNLHLTIVSLNDYDHYENQRLLYEEMFRKYQKKLIFSKETFQKKYPGYYLKKDLYYPLKSHEEPQIEIVLPKNNLQGEIIVSLNNQEVMKEPIYEIKEKKVNSKKVSFWDKFKEFFGSWF